MWATSKKCVFYGIFKNTTKHQKIFFEIFFEMQPNTWKHFLFRKIAFPKNIYFPEMLLHEPNAAFISLAVKNFHNIIYSEEASEQEPLLWISIMCVFGSNLKGKLILLFNFFYIIFMALLYFLVLFIDFTVLF